MAPLLEGQPLDGPVLIVLVDAYIPQCHGYIRVVQYLLDRNGVMRLLVHVITECLSQRMRAYAADTKYLPGISQNIIGLLAAYCLVGKTR